MSKTLKIDREKIKNIHLNTTFFIYMVGFIPGTSFYGRFRFKAFFKSFKNTES